MKNIQGDQIALFLSGQDVPVPECNIIIHQPTIKQVVLFKETNFLTAVSLWGDIPTVTKQVRDSNPMADNYSDFQILMALMNQDPTLQNSVDSLFKLIFPRYNVEVTDSEIHFYDGERRVGVVHDRNYLALGNIIDALFSLPNKDKDYNPANEKAFKIAEKFKERAKKLASMKGKTETTATLFGTYVSILSVGMNIDINTLWEYTPFQLYDTFIRYWKKSGSDFYQRVSTMPMMDTSKLEEPDPWTDNLY